MFWLVNRINFKWFSLREKLQENLIQKLKKISNLLILNNFLINFLKISARQGAAL